MEEIFTKNKKIISVFITAGYPELNSTLKICGILERVGVDLIEIGIPCSDPLADGPVIQNSSTVALQNGFKLKRFFEDLRELKNYCTIPVILMGYYNQVLQFGEREFIEKSKSCGISGFIIPDQPFESLFQDLCFDYNLKNIRMICPTTPVDRIKQLDQLSTGFLYAVSGSSTTGDANGNISSYLKEIPELKLKSPVLTGFGIRNKETFDKAVEFTDGGIIGSAFMNIIEENNNIDEFAIHKFISSLN